MAYIKGRYVKSNLSCEHPTQWIALDTETVTVQGRQKLRLGVAIFWVMKRGVQSRREVCHFENMAGFWLWLENKLDRKRTTVIAAHNAPFDLTVLEFWFRLELGAIKVKFAVFDSPPLIVDTRINGCRAVFVDTRNWFRCSLADLGDCVGVKKYPMPSLAASFYAWQQYCARDTEIVETALLALVRFMLTNDLGVFRFTAAAQAFQAYRHRLGMRRVVNMCKECNDVSVTVTTGTKVLPLLHDERPALKLERDAYYGGYVSCFQLGRIDKPTYVLDANSMYPSLYAQRDYPCRLIHYAKGMSAEQILSASVEHCVISRVKLTNIRTEFPYRDKYRTYWAKGTFWATLCGPELVRAIAESDVVQIGCTAIYERQPILRTFGLEFLRLRQIYKRAGNYVFEHLAKLMGNALHGKFGQRSCRWKIVHMDNVPQHWGNWVELDADSEEMRYYRGVGSIVQERQDRGEGSQSFPAIPAFVSAYARENLRRWIKIAGPENVRYVCVDCLHVSQAGYELLLLAGELEEEQAGKLRVEGKYSSAEYKGIGHYLLDGIETAQGVPASARQDESGTWHWPTFTHLSEIIGHGPDGGIRKRFASVKLPALYKHGVVHADGRVDPFVIGVDKLPDSD